MILKLCNVWYAHQASLFPLDRRLENPYPLQSNRMQVHDFVKKNISQLIPAGTKFVRVVRGASWIPYLYTVTNEASLGTVKLSNLREF